MEKGAQKRQKPGRKPSGNPTKGKPRKRSNGRSDAPNLAHRTVTIEKAQRKARVAEMRARGWTLQQMAEKEGVSTTQIHRDVREIIDDLALASMEDLRRFRADQALQRIAMIKAHYSIAIDPEDERCIASAGIVDRNQTALAKLYGLDAPQVIHQLTEQVEDKAPVVTGFVIDVASTKGGETQRSNMLELGQEALRRINAQTSEKKHEPVNVEADILDVEVEVEEEERSDG